jgi:hypothetical protein
MQASQHFGDDEAQSVLCLLIAPRLFEDAAQQHVSTFDSQEASDVCADNRWYLSEVMRALSRGVPSLVPLRAVV